MFCSIPCVRWAETSSEIKSVSTGSRCGVHEHGFETAAPFTREHSSRNLNANLIATTTIDPATRLHDLSWVNIFPTPWEEKRGQSRQQSVVFKTTKWLNLNYNRFDGLKYETLAYDINGDVLQKPTGKTKDNGIALRLLDEKPVARMSRYEPSRKTRATARSQAQR